VVDGDNYHLHFDGQQLLTVNSKLFSTAMEAWYSVFWVFSVKYPECLNYTCLFIEQYCMGHRGTAPGAVKRLGNKIVT